MTTDGHATGTEAGSAQDAFDGRYEVVVIGGGPAGLTTALYTARMNHDTLVVDRGGGRAVMMQDAHNIIGVTEDVSGTELLATAVDQLEQYGADVLHDTVVDVTEHDDGDGFVVETRDGFYAADRVVLATGFSDEAPDPPLPRTGRGLHYCLYCDGEMFRNEPVYVMGHETTAAYVAMIMLNFTDDVDLLLRGEEPAWSDETDELLAAHPVEVVEDELDEVHNGDDGWLEALVFADGTRREYAGGFAMYGADYNDGLARALGCETDDGEVVVDDVGRTSREGVYAVGDLTPGRKQIPIAMGEGATAGIALHKELREYPKPLDELRGDGSPAARQTSD